MHYIYKLTDGEKDYYGQTENTKQRLGYHKAPSCSCRSRLLDKTKMNMYIIHTLYTQQEADETESFYQLNFDCVNNSVTGRTREEYKLTNKEYYKEYNKKYYEDNKEKLNKYNTEYRENNKEKLNNKHTCECGGSYSKKHKSTHFINGKHQKYINQK